MEHDAEGLIAGVQLVGIEPGQFLAQGVGRRETVGPSVVVREIVQPNRLDGGHPNVAGPRNVTPLAGSHPRVFPQTDRLRFGTLADGRQEFFLE